MGSAFLLAVAGLSIVYYLKTRQRDYNEMVRAVESKDLAWAVPDFHLTERSGKPVSRDDLKGKVWLAAFVFSRCTGSCPAVTATLAKIQHETADMPDLRLVTFTVDPERDTPDELKKYAERYGADPTRWLFLTGPEAEIHTLAQKGFFFATGRNKDRKAGEEEFLHTTKIALVDADGNIQQVFDGLFKGPTAETDQAIAAQKIKLAAQKLKAGK